MTYNNAKFDVPILFLVFNRPDYTQRVFNIIKQIQPKKLYIAADGPRCAAAGDDLKCSKVRQITEDITWDCEVSRLYRENNLGCKEAIYSGINWFFSEVTEGIIIEDDILPSPDFFPFCKELLSFYQNNEKVMMITGTSYFFNKVAAPKDYHFSALGTVWGWASWRRAWELMNLNPGFIDKNQIIKSIKHPEFSSYFYETVLAAAEGRLDTWDAQWAYSIIKNSALVARPFKNLIKNIGVSGTHAGKDGKTSKLFEMPYGKFDTASINHPVKIEIDTETDMKTFNAIVKYAGLKKTLSGKIKQKLSRIYILLKKLMHV